MITSVGHGATVSRTGAGTLTVALPTGVANNDVVFLQASQDANTTNVSDPAGWTLLKKQVGASSVRPTTYVWYKVLAPGFATTVAITVPASAGIEAECSAYRGVDPITPIDIAAESAAVGSTSGPIKARLSRNTTVINCMLVGWVSRLPGVNIVKDAAGGDGAFTTQYTVSALGVSCYSGYRTLAKVTDSTTKWVSCSTPHSAGQWTWVAAALRPAAPIPTTNATLAALTGQAPDRTAGVLLSEKDIYQSLLSVQTASKYVLPSGIWTTAKPVDYVDSVLALTPAAYWRFGEASGTAAGDRSGNDRIGTYTNAPTLGIASPILNDKDTAVDFASASSQYVTVPDGSGALRPGAGHFTVAAWVKRTGTPGASEFVLAKGDATISGYEMFVNAFGTVSTRIGAITIDGVKGVCDGNWHQVVITMSRSGNCVIYIDGVADKTQSIASESGRALNSAAALEIARRSTGNYWNGSIDEVAVYIGTALSAASVLAQFQAATAVKTGSQWGGVCWQRAGAGTIQTNSAAAGTYQKTTASGADARLWSRERYPSNVLLTVTPRQTNCIWTAGLDDTPTGNATGTPTQATFVSDVLGNWTIYEGGVTTGVTGTYVSGDVFRIEYDGVNLVYKVNGVTKRTQALAVANDLYAYVGFNTLNTILDAADYTRLTNANQGGDAPQKWGPSLQWLDTSYRVRGLSWGRGADQPGGRPRVGVATVTLDNTDGDVSPWGNNIADGDFTKGGKCWLIPRTLMRFGCTTVMPSMPLYATMAGDANGLGAMYINDSPGNSPTAGIDIRMRLSLADWTPLWGGPYLIYKDQEYGISIADDNTLHFFWYDNGVTFHSATSTAALSTLGLGDGQIYWVRVTMDAATGHTKFWVAFDTPGTGWVQLGADVVFGATTFRNHTSQVLIGHGGTAGTTGLTGNLYRVEIRDNIDGNITSAAYYDGTMGMMADAGGVMDAYTGDFWTNDGPTDEMMSMGGDTMWHPWFTGTVESLQENTSENVDDWIDVTLVETSSSLAQVNKPGVLQVGLLDSFTNRVNRLLADAGWQYATDLADGQMAADMLADPGFQATTMTGDRLAELLQTGDSLGIVFLSSGQGDLRARPYLMDTMSMWTFSNAASDVSLQPSQIQPVKDVKFYASTDRILNIVTANRLGGVAKTVQSQPSIDKYGPIATGQDFPMTDLLGSSDATISSLIAAQLLKSAFDENGIESFELDMDMDPIYLPYPMVHTCHMGPDMRMAMTVIWHHPSGSSFTKLLIVDGYTANITMEGGQAKFTMSVNTSTGIPATS